MTITYFCVIGLCLNRDIQIYNTDRGLNALVEKEQNIKIFGTRMGQTQVSNLIWDKKNGMNLIKRMWFVYLEADNKLMVIITRKLVIQVYLDQIYYMSPQDQFEKQRNALIFCLKY